MTKKIEEFMTAFADHINHHIVGTEETLLKECILTDKVTVKGHLIRLKICLPKELERGTAQFDPCVYAEELMEQFPGHTPAGIAELINNQITKQYGKFVQLALKEQKVTKTPLDGYPKEDLILTAIPSEMASDMSMDSIITKELPEKKLRLIMKARLSGVDGEEGHAYFAPVFLAGGRDAGKEDWEIAHRNSMCHTDIRLEKANLPYPDGSETDTIGYGAIMDEHSFYEYFYLLDAENVWGPVMEQTCAESLYIFPGGPYGAIFVVDNKEIRKDHWLGLAQKMALAEFAQGVDGISYVYVIDRDTMELEILTKIRKDPE